MASFEVRFKPSVERDFRRLPKLTLARILARIDDLRSDPLPRQVVKLSGAERLYRVRVGDYRVIYEVDLDARQIVVQHVRHRREAYRRP